MARLSSEKLLCVFCKLPHRVYHKQDIHILDILLLFLITGIFSFLVWDEPNNKSLILFGAMTIFLQVFVKVRWRQSLRCPHCSFDPVIYQKRPEEAAQAVKAFLEQRKTDPRYLLRTQPKIKPIIEKTDTWKQNLFAKVDKPSVPDVESSVDL